MNDDLKDIDPAVVEKILENADTFIEIDKRVDDIVMLGEQELKSREERLKTSNGTLEDFKKAATEVETTVSENLKNLEKEIQARYS